MRATPLAATSVDAQNTKVGDRPIETGDDFVLSARERQCLKWVATGKTDGEIAEIIGISHQTVHKHICNALRRLEATTRAHAVAIAITRCLISL